MFEPNQIEEYLRLMICPEMCRSVIFIDPPPFRIHAHGPLMVSMHCASACEQPRNGRKLARGAQYHRGSQYFKNYISFSRGASRVPPPECRFLIRFYVKM